MEVPLTIRDFLDRALAVYPERIAVVDEPGTPGSLAELSYGELDERARGMALALDEMGVGPGERVAILSPNAARFLISFFGVSGYGRVLVPINYRLNADEISYIVDHSGASVVLVDPESDERVGKLSAKHRVVLDGASDASIFARVGSGSSLQPRQWIADESATVSINYTSGTTARPKGVELTHRSCWLNACVFGWQLGVSDRDTYLHTLPMFHCNGWGVPYAVTGMGVTQVIVRQIDGEEILRRIERHGVTLLCAAPAVVAAVLEAAAARREAGLPAPGAGHVRIVVAGAPPPTRTIERVRSELGWEFIQLYGLTETSPLLTMNRLRSEWEAEDPATVGRLLARAGVPALGVRLAISDEGEVMARSNHVFAGYWHQPAETQEALAGDWFHTGDGGHIESGNYLVIEDRKKDVIISGGENVSSAEVEDCLYQHSAIAEAAIIGVPSERWGETVKALIVLRPGEQATESELIEHCRARLAHFKCPSSVEFRETLPRTATGKLQKFKLREPYWHGYDRRVH